MVSGATRAASLNATTLRRPMRGNRATRGRLRKEVLDMNKLMIATFCASAVLLAACGKNKLLAAAENYEKEACACKDGPCATAAASKFAEETKKGGVSAPTTGAEAEAYRAAVQNATQCVAKLTVPKMPMMPNMPMLPGAPPATK